MKLDRITVEEFQSAYKSDYAGDLSTAEAEEIASRLLRLARAIFEATDRDGGSAIRPASSPQSPQPPN